MNFGVCDFSRFAVTDWRQRFLALNDNYPYVRDPPKGEHAFNPEFDS